MNNTNLIGSCQAHLPVQFASNIEFLHLDVTLMLWLKASHTRVARIKQALCLLHWLSVFHCHVLHSNKTVNTIQYIKYKIVLSPKL